LIYYVNRSIIYSETINNIGGTIMVITIFKRCQTLPEAWDLIFMEEKAPTFKKGWKLTSKYRKARRGSGYDVSFIYEKAA